MIRTGDIIVAGGITGNYTISGLGMNPRRIWFRSATKDTVLPPGICHGVASADVPPVAPSPYKQSAILVYVAGGNSASVVQEDVVVYIRDPDPPNARITADLTEMTDNAFTLRVVTNTLAADTIIQWVATN